MAPSRHTGGVHDLKRNLETLQLSKCRAEHLVSIDDGLDGARESLTIEVALESHDRLHERGRIVVVREPELPLLQRKLEGLRGLHEITFQREVRGLNCECFVTAVGP